MTTPQNIELGYLANGNIAFMSDTAFPGRVKRVEYYRDQRLLMVIYQDNAHEDDLMQYEISEDAAHKVEHSPEVLIYEDNAGDGQPNGYYTSLVQIAS